MTTNRDRALSLLNDLAERMDDDAVSTLDAVQGLHDAGLLADDLPTPDRDGRWRLAAHYTLHLDATHHDGPVAVIRGKHGPLTTIPVDDLQHIGDVMHAAAHACQKEKP